MSELFYEYRINQAQDSKDIEMILSCVQNMLNLRQIQFKSYKSPVHIQFDASQTYCADNGLKSSQESTAS